MGQRKDLQLHLSTADRYYPSWDCYHCDKITGLKATCGGKDLFGLHSQSTVNEGSQIRNPNLLRTWRQELMQEPWSVLFTSLLSLLSYRPKYPQARDNILTIICPHPISVTDYANALQLDLREVFFQLKFPPFWRLWLASSWHKTI